MLRRKNPSTPEHATRFGSRANAALGVFQLGFGAISGNYGFMTESMHQGADSVSLGAKANAMREDCTPAKALRLRRFAASILIIGGALGIGGGLKHIHDDTKEDSAPLEVGGAFVGAVVNTVIARKSHGSHDHDDEHSHDHSGDHAHQAGAAFDSALHIMTDMGTGWLYAGALMAESRVPGISTAALITNGIIIGGVGSYTIARVQRDERAHSSHATE